MCPGNIFLGYVFYQFTLYFIGRVGLCRDKSQTVAYAEDVGVDGHGGLAEGYALNDVGCLAPYARQVKQLVHV